MFTLGVNGSSFSIGNGSSSTMATSTSMDSFGNDTLFDGNDFSEDELLLRMIWNNATSMATADINSSGESFILDQNMTNRSVVGGSVAVGTLDYENAWQLATSIATAMILGFIILATVIGKIQFFFLIFICILPQKK